MDIEFLLSNEMFTVYSQYDLYVNWKLKAQETWSRGRRFEKDVLTFPQKKFGASDGSFDDGFSKAALLAAGGFLSSGLSAF